MNSMSLELDEIQGNVLAGFNTNIEVFVGLTADRQRLGELARWLASLASTITSVADLRREREVMKAPLRGEPSSAVWFGVAIGPELLALIRPDMVFQDEAFVRGFIKRSAAVLGDRTDPKGWRVNSPAKPLDILLTIASNDATLVEAKADELLSAARSAGMAATYRETARRIEGLEHFGFRDGISQPRVKGIDAGDDMNPGHFVFGYERFPGDPNYLPATDPGGFVRNGSFMVFRRLAQDVAAFRDFCVRKVAELGDQLPGLTDKHFAALLVGRWPSGALATMGVAQDPGSGPGENDFDFSDDPIGRTCPFGSHIRKVNPRAGPKDLVNVPRLLRRGIPFGPRFEEHPSAERGLAFVSFQTSIVEQLELLTSGWMNSPIRPAPNAGHDLLVGRSRGERSLSLPGPQTSVVVSDGGQQWITPTGGGYLFTPSRSALARIAEPPSPGLGWRADRLINSTRTFLKGLLEL